MQNLDASGVGAGLVELGDIGRIELEARRLHDLLHLFHLRGAGNRRGQARARHEPGQGDLGRNGALAGGDRIESGQDPPAPVVEIGRHAPAAHALAEIRFRPVLAGQEAAGEAVIGDDPDLLLPAERLQFRLVFGAVVQIVFRLQAFVARQAELGADLRALPSGARP